MTFSQHRTLEIILGVSMVLSVRPVNVFAAAEPTPRTSLSDPSIRYSVPEKPYVELQRGDIIAVVVDHRAVDDAVLPGHRAGYSGLASLRHTRQSRNLFVPAYAGLNFEHITQVFRAADQVRLVQSPSGGGDGCPAWDFQWLIPGCRVDQRYQMMMRALYTPWPGGAGETEGQETLRQRAKELATFQTASFSAEAVARRAFGGVQPVVSPNGKTVALSFQGSIARMPAEGGTLTRLTREPGWDLDPAWWPDGKRIAFINSERFVYGQLRIIAAEDGAPVALPKAVTARGKLQFHPAGQRLLGVFATTGFPERLHWYDLVTGGLTPVSIGSLDAVHHARMKWTLSPDGDTILFTRNDDVPGEQDGSQGPITEVWQVPSNGGAPQLVTRWPARIYGLWWIPGMEACFIVTDRGGALNDIWQLPLEGALAGARRITSGQTDEDSPSVSADGRWLVHSENSDRATALARIDLPSGRRESPSIDRVDFREATGRLRVEVRDADTGEPITARVSVAQPNGKSHFPLGALYRLIWGTGSYYGWDDELELPVGRCTIDASHGPEYVTGHVETGIVAGQTRSVTLKLERWANMPERGWFSGENHIHANYGVGAWHCDQQTVRDQCEGEDLHVGNIVVANSNGDGVFDREFFLGQPDPFSKPRTILYWNEEFRSTIWGHLTLGNLDQLVEPVFTGFKGTTNPWDVPTNADIAERTRAQGGTVSYTHPAMDRVDPYKSAYSGKGLPVDAALGRVDTVDVMGGGYHESLVLWYSLLNCGFRIPAAAGTDVFLNRIVSNPPGWGRAYVNLGRRLTYADWMRGQRAGRSFVTSGPMLEMTAGSLMPGDSLSLEAPGEVPLRARAWSHQPLDTLEVLVSGRVVKTIQPAANGREAVFDGTVPLDRSGWLAVRCTAEGRSKSAHMNPIWVEIRGHPCDARSDAGYLMKWIDRLETDLRQRGRLPGPGLDHAMKQLEAARAVYRKLSSG